MGAAIGGGMREKGEGCENEVGGLIRDCWAVGGEPGLIGSIKGTGVGENVREG